MLREVRLFEAEPLLYRAGGQFAFLQHFQNCNTGRVREGLKDICFVGLQQALHDISIFENLNIRNRHHPIRSMSLKTRLEAQGSAVRSSARLLWWEQGGSRGRPFDAARQKSTQFGLFGFPADVPDQPDSDRGPESPSGPVGHNSTEFDTF